MKQIFYLIFPVLFAACGYTIPEGRLIDADPPITPDYLNITIPPNIAPLYFALTDSIKEAYAIFTAKSRIVTVKSQNGQFKISEKKWRDLLQNSIGQKISVKITLINNCKEILQYRPFELQVTEEKIDPYIAYRLIEPGYELWNKMGIYQRNLENFKQTPIFENRLTNGNCMNCHSFCMQNPEKMLFHLRAKFPGTILINGKNVEKLNTKTPETISNLVYPSWHPSGRYVAFSVNTTKQGFHSNDANRIEVYDEASDVVVYDVENHEIISNSLIFSENSFETFPTFSPDGKTLYFCSAKALPMPNSFKDVHYSLCSIAFDPENRNFGSSVDTLYNAETECKSVSFPRVSPNGRFLIFTLSSYGNFSIWHKDANLYIIDLQTNEIKPMIAINSEDVESYHSWSSNSHWLVFSSRRIDGLYTRPFIAYINEHGEASKPFLLPQNDVKYYDRLMKSFNIPEFVKGKVEVNMSKIASIAKKDKGTDLKFVE